MHLVKRLRPSPAMIVAIVALVLSLGGTSYAAIVLPANSVGTKQIKKSAVVSSKVKNESLTTSDVKNESLTTSDVKDGSLTTADVADGSLTTADISGASLSTLGRVAMASNQVNITAASRIAVVRITAPQAGFVLVNGWVNVNGLNGICTVKVYDDVAGTGSPYKNVIRSTGPEVSGGNIGVFPVAAGERGFSVRLEDVTGALQVWGTVTAQFIPYDGAGAQPAP